MPLWELCQRCVRINLHLEGDSWSNTTGTNIMAQEALFGLAGHALSGFAFQLEV